MHRFFAAMALALVASCTAHPVFAQVATVAPAGPTPVVIPWGEWTIAIVNSFVLPIILPLIGALGTWIFVQMIGFFPWLKRFVTAQLVERLLTNVLDFGVNAVMDAAKGKTLSISTGQAVLDAALRRAIAVGNPAIVKAAGGEAELAVKLFRKMDLEPEATIGNVLDPVIRRLDLDRGS